MPIQSLTLADDILTGVFALTGGLTLITKPASWNAAGHDMLGLELSCDADWTLSWSATGDAITVLADTVVRVNIRKQLLKNVTTIPGIYVSGTGNLQLLAHKMAPFADQA